jgi:hypothetical protein
MILILVSYLLWQRQTSISGDTSNPKKTLIDLRIAANECQRCLDICPYVSEMIELLSKVQLNVCATIKNGPYMLAYQKALIAMKSRMYDDAIPLLKEMKSNLSIMSMLAECYYHLDMTYDAYNLYKHIKAKNPHQVIGMDFFANVLGDIGKFEELQALAENVPTSQRSYNLSSFVVADTVQYLGMSQL